jgi:hypothetical protein
MSTSIRLLLILCTLTITHLNVLGGDRFQFTFHGTCWTTNANGKLISRAVSQASWLSDYAASNGITNANSLALVYHLGGDDRGDVIEVVNATNGTLITPLWALFFGDNFGRMSLVDNTGTRFRRIQYVYGQQIAESVGSAFLSERIFLDQNGNTNALSLQGPMTYEIQPDVNHATLQVCQGTLLVTKPAKFVGTNAP